MQSLHYYYKQTGRRITIEYVMLDEINDQPEKAKELATLIKDLHCHVNLIPYNPIDHSLEIPNSSSTLQRSPKEKIYK